MKIEFKGTYKGHNYTKTHLTLGIQTAKGLTDQTIMRKAQSWAPKKARSFTVKSVNHRTPEGNKSKEETGLATFQVEYFTTKKEGVFINSLNV